jgi:hypothetical protein
MLLFVGVLVLILSLVAQILMIVFGLGAVGWAFYNLFIVKSSKSSSKKRRRS